MVKGRIAYYVAVVYICSTLDEEFYHFFGTSATGLVEKCIVLMYAVGQGRILLQNSSHCFEVFSDYKIKDIFRSVLVGCGFSYAHLI